MRKKQFKAESKRLLDMMINSIYTHKEIFLRELISNASDAIDKLYFRSLTDGNINIAREDYEVNITLDKENRQIVIADNGVGMTQEELENNLGIIANSGSFNFKRDNNSADDVEIIGQFGVGFYSAFMVSSKVTVVTKAYGADTAYRWESEGADGYSIEECEKDSFGTDIYLTLKPNENEESYDEFLEPMRISALVKKYSDYIRYPIKMEMEHHQLKEGSEDEYETVMQLRTLNSMVPIWKKNKSEVKDEEYNDFYKDKFMDYMDPIKVIHSKTEGSATYSALMFIPAKAPYDYYSKEYEKGLQLYSNGVLIMDKCADLLPDHFSFVKGLVDSQDLSLNISREMLQHDRQLKLIKTSLEKKIKSELEKMLKNEREKYDEFFKVFGLQLKIGAYSYYGANKELLKNLLMFYSGKQKKLITFAEYLADMKEGQTDIYYATGKSYSAIECLPQTEIVKEKDYDILYMIDDVDEFVIKVMGDYEGKQFKSVSADDLDLTTDDEKKQLEKSAEENSSLFNAMTEALTDKVKKVKPSNRLKTHPVCISSEGEITLEMEKVLNSMPMDQKVKADRVLEININHPIFETLCGIKDDKDKLASYTELLYDQALLIEGLPIENPIDFSNKLCELMTDKK